jgi:hypothetical protein
MKISVAVISFWIFVLLFCTSCTISTTITVTSPATPNVSTPSTSLTKTQLKITANSIPQGTYKASFPRGWSVTFKGDTLTYVSAITLKYKYQINNDGNYIYLTGIGFDETENFTYKYYEEDECVVINGTTFYK